MAPRRSDSVFDQTVDFDESLKIQQDLLLRIMDAISVAGTALALPLKPAFLILNCLAITKEHDDGRS